VRLPAACLLSTRRPSNSIAHATASPSAPERCRTPSESAHTSHAPLPPARPPGNSSPPPPACGGGVSGVDSASEEHAEGASGVCALASAGAASLLPAPAPVMLSSARAAVASTRCRTAPVSAVERGCSRRGGLRCGGRRRGVGPRNLGRSQDRPELRAVCGRSVPHHRARLGVDKLPHVPTAGRALSVNGQRGERRRALAASVKRWHGGGYHSYTPRFASLRISRSVCPPQLYVMSSPGPSSAAISLGGRGAPTRAPRSEGELSACQADQKSAVVPLQAELGDVRY